jgi:hypothetical protein
MPGKGRSGLNSHRKKRADKLGRQLDKRKVKVRDAINNSSGARVIGIPEAGSLGMGSGGNVNRDTGGWGDASQQGGGEELVSGDEAGGRKVREAERHTARRGAEVEEKGAAMTELKRRWRPAKREEMKKWMEAELLRGECSIQLKWSRLEVVTSKDRRNGADDLFVALCDGFRRWEFEPCCCPQDGTRHLVMNEMNVCCAISPLYRLRRHPVLSSASRAGSGVMFPTGVPPLPWQHRALPGRPLAWSPERKITESSTKTG